MSVRFTTFALATSLSAVGFATQAAEWKIDPTLRLSGGYDDNIRLTTDDEVSSAVATFSPSSLFSVETPTSGVSGEVRFDFRRYSEDSDLNDNNSRLDLDAFHRFERAQLGLDLAYINDTTLDSQLEATGVVFDRIRRRRITASPSWTWLLSERTNLSAQYSYSNVDYKNAGGSGFVNYELHSGSLSLARVMSERATATLSLSSTRSENDNHVTSVYTNLQAGTRYRVSETLSTSLFAGVRHTRVDYTTTSLVPVFSGGTFVGFAPVSQDESNSDWGFLFSGSLTKKFLRGETSLSLTRDISNDINGTPIEVNRLRWQNLYRFSEIFSGQLGVELYDSQYSSAIGQSQGSNFYQVQPEFTWYFARFWRLTGSYRYRIQTYDNSNDDATQNAVYLTVSYHWPRIAVSR